MISDGVHRRLPAGARLRPHRFPGRGCARPVPLDPRADLFAARRVPAVSRATTTAATPSPRSPRSAPSIRAWAARLSESRLRRLHGKPRPPAPEADRRRRACEPPVRLLGRSRRAAWPRQRSHWAPPVLYVAGFWEVPPEWVAEHLPQLQLIDVREPRGVRRSTRAHRRRAASAAGHAWRPALNQFDRERPVVTVCRAGGRSAQATTVLQRAGFSKVANLAGGMLRGTRRACRGGAAQ